MFLKSLFLHILFLIVVFLWLFCVKIAFMGFFSTFECVLGAWMKK